MKKLFLLLPLLFATAPAYLEHTLLPARFTAAFTTYQFVELRPPLRVPDNRVFYLETAEGRYFKSFFAQSALLPGAPVRFKDTPVWWYVVRDPAHHNQYTARVYSDKWKEWALVAINLGPPRRDLIARYHEHLTVPPAARGEGVIVGNPPKTAIEWFYTSGHNPPNVPQPDQGYFAVYAKPTESPLDHRLYKLPYSIVGKGSGVLHQAYGQLVYSRIDLTPNLTPDSFRPPANYTRVVTPQVNPVVATALLYNCTVCHYTDPSLPTTLYEPQLPQKSSGIGDAILPSR